MYKDNTSTYQFRYTSPGLTFGSPSRTKLVKDKAYVGRLDDGTVFVKWVYDFSTAFKIMRSILEIKIQHFLA